MFSTASVRLYVLALYSFAAIALYAQDHPSQLVDINRASVVQLTQATGMPKSWAGRIVRFRPYRTKLDLIELGVVTPDIYNHIRISIIAHRVSPSAKQPSPEGQTPGK